MLNGELGSKVANLVRINSTTINETVDARSVSLRMPGRGFEPLRAIMPTRS